LLTAPRVQADIHGGIEIGARGVKATVLDVTGGVDSFKIKVLMARTQNTTLAAGMAETGRFGASALTQTAEAVSKFASQMQREYHVPLDRLYVVGSSGLFSAIEGKPDAIRTNQEALAIAVRKASGLKISFIDVNKEVELSIAGIVPARHADTALLLDVGGGNTKGGYQDGRQGLVSMGIPYGSVTFTDLIKKRTEKQPLAATAAALRDEVLVSCLRTAMAGKLGLLKRDRIYLTGGAAWALATLIRPGDRRDYVALTAEDVDAYRNLLIEAGDSFPAPDLSAIVDQMVLRAAQREIAQVKAAFRPEQLLAGAEIIKALSNEFQFGKAKKVFFVRHAQFGWILAYVAQKGRP
jgi:exopolyphosphatase/pppGpp-phosphohydrolase